MSKYEVTANDTLFGVYEAETEEGARNACAIDAGYDSEAHMSQELGEPSALVATEVEEWRTWIDGKRDEAVTFFYPAGGSFDIDAAANALGVDVCEELNVERV